eukprot:COSAG05_NODE_4894_length_1334_cov_1.290688_1_plen_65_part_00
MGEGAAKVITDAKRKSKILMKSDALAKQAKGSIMQTAAYAEIKEGLPANETLNAADFLGKTQVV